MEEFQLSKFTKEGAQLLRDVTKEFNQLGVDASQLPKTFPDDSGKIKLVFVGQYSAGKSSIIKMLTGAEVEIGAAITTQTSTPYDWHGLEIIDTPGIHTELRPDHDEITYDQINHAALLIFVITNEGFSQRMGRHFRLLAIEGKRAANMVLVVNKMDRTALGNVPEQQQIIYEDLKKVTAPYDPNDLYISFTDTESYFKAMEETDERRRARRLKRSGHDVFIDKLNQFVEQKGILQKINLPLNTIAATIRDALPTVDNSDAEKFIGTIEKRKAILIDGKRECLDDVADIISDFKNEISRSGRDTAVSATTQETEAAVKDVLNAAQDKMTESAKICSQKVLTRIKTFLDQTNIELQNYEQKEFVQKITVDFINSIKTKGQDEYSQMGAGGVVGMGGMAAGALIFQNGAQFAAQFAEVAVTPLGEAIGGMVKFGVNVALAEDAGILSGLIANEAGNLVRGLPFFRVEPTWTNRLAQFIAPNAKIIGAAVAGAAMILGAYLQHREDEKLREAEKKLSAARQNIISKFNDKAQEIAQGISADVNKLMAKYVDPIVKDWDEKIKAVKAQTANEELKREKLSALLKQTENLIAEIQTYK